MEKYQGKYRIPSARLTNYDYGSPGLYFITICTKDRTCFFGEILPHIDGTHNRKETQNFASLHSSEIGLIAQQYWLNIPNHFAFIELDEFVIMPNHVHGILFLNNPDHSSWHPNKFAPQSRNLPSVIRGYKAGVKKYATLNSLDFGWQPRYFDRVIRSETELQKIREYIQNNPNKWDQDKNNPEGILM